MKLKDTVLFVTAMLIIMLLTSCGTLLRSTARSADMLVDEAAEVAVKNLDTVVDDAAEAGIRNADVIDDAAAQSSRVGDYFVDDAVVARSAEEIGLEQALKNVRGGESLIYYNGEDKDTIFIDNVPYEIDGLDTHIGQIGTLEEAIIESVSYERGEPLSKEEANEVSEIVFSGLCEFSAGAGIESSLEFISFVQDEVHDSVEPEWEEPYLLEELVVAVSESDSIIKEVTFSLIDSLLPTGC